MSQFVYQNDLIMDKIVASDSHFAAVFIPMNQNLNYFFKQKSHVVVVLI